MSAKTLVSALGLITVLSMMFFYALPVMRKRRRWLGAGRLEAGVSSAERILVSMMIVGLLAIVYLRVSTDYSANAIPAIAWMLGAWLAAFALLGLLPTPVLGKLGAWVPIRWPADADRRVQNLMVAAVIPLLTWSAWITRG